MDLGDVSQMKLSQLMAAARDQGMPQDLLDEMLDTENPKAAIVELLREGPEAAPRIAADASALALVDLPGLPPTELNAGERAISDEVVSGLLGADRVNRASSLRALGRMFTAVADGDGGTSSLASMSWELVQLGALDLIVSTVREEGLHKDLRRSAMVVMACVASVPELQGAVASAGMLEVLAEVLEPQKHHEHQALAASAVASILYNRHEWPAVRPPRVLADNPHAEQQQQQQQQQSGLSSELALVSPTDGGSGTIAIAADGSEEGEEEELPAVSAAVTRLLDTPIVRPALLFGH